MAFERVLLRTWSKNILFSAMVELTYRCNLDCFFCYNDLQARGRPLSRDQYFQLLEELRDLQVLNLILTGGEPLAHPDFFALGARARELGFVVRIKSNGHALRGQLAERLRQEVDPFVIDLSLHGARAAAHDRQTRVSGSFDRLMENIPELLSLGLRLKLNCTLTRWNEAEVEEIFALADRLGLPIAVNPVVSPRDDGGREPLALTASREGKLRLFRLLDERARRRQGSERHGELGRQADDGIPAPESEKNCGAGSSSITVDPYGNVLPCVQWRRPVGNLHRASIREIWEGARGLDEVRRLTGEAKKMVDGHGPDGRLMAFCPGLAELATGDPLGLYDDAEEQMALLGQVNQETERGRPLLPVVS